MICTDYLQCSGVHSRCTTVTKLYIYFKHTLFGQGIRSLLRGQRSIQIVGMEKDEAKSVEAIQTLNPEVVIVEESGRGISSATLGAILRKPGVGRVVTLDIDHNYATVYDRRCTTTARPEDLVKAIRKGLQGQASAPDVRCSIAKSPRSGMSRGKSPPGRRARDAP